MQPPKHLKLQFFSILEHYVMFGILQKVIYTLDNVFLKETFFFKNH